MELIAFGIAILACSILLHWVLGMVYGLLLRPPVYFPFSLAGKMALAVVIGLPLAGVGGIALALFLFHTEFSKRPDYKLLPGLLAGAVITLIGTAASWYLGVHLAWDMLG